MLVVIIKIKVLNCFTSLLKGSGTKHGYKQFEETSGLLMTTVGFAKYIVYQDSLQGIQMIRPGFGPSIFAFSKENEEGTHSKKRAKHDRFLQRRSMNITTPTVRPIEIINESEGNGLKTCAVQIVKV